MTRERRPAEYQVRKIYRCNSCSQRIEIDAEEACGYFAIQCGDCGSRLTLIGESYPSYPEDWHEERSDNGERRNTRQ